MADFHKPSSPYRLTEVKDFYLDLWEPVEVEPQEDDTMVIIAAAHNERPDKLSYSLYGTPGLFWIFWMRNKDVIIDPIYDFTSGKTIYVPSKEYVTKNILG